MTTAASVSSAPTASARPRLRTRVRVGQALLSVVLAVAGVVGISTAFSDDPFPHAAVVLIASFASLAAVLGLTAVWGGIRSRTVRIGLIAVPLFFVWHVAALGTWVPDAAFAVIAAVGVVLVLGSGRDS